MARSKWPVAQLPTALAEISIEELNSFSLPEDASILPGRVHKGGCVTLWHLEFGSLPWSKQVTPHACCRAQDTTGDL